MGHGWTKEGKGDRASIPGPRHRQLITQIYVPIVHCLGLRGPAATVNGFDGRRKKPCACLPACLPALVSSGTREVCSSRRRGERRQRTNDREDGRRGRCERSRVKMVPRWASVDRLESAIRVCREGDTRCDTYSRTRADHRCSIRSARSLGHSIPRPRAFSLLFASVSPTESLVRVFLPPSKLLFSLFLLLLLSFSFSFPFLNFVVISIARVAALVPEPRADQDVALRSECKCSRHSEAGEYGE